MLYSPAEAMARALFRLGGMGRRYGIEWWILVVGALIILGIVFMAIFASHIAPFVPMRCAPPGGASWGPVF